MKYILTVYHGTLAGEEILKSGYIESTNKNNSVYGINEGQEKGRHNKIGS